jgi:hypothetical protein
MLSTLGCFAAATAGNSAAPAGGASVDPRREMIAVLGAENPHRTIGAEARVFDRFVGTWDVDYSNFGEDGSVRHFAGELRFGWILDGRAIQDIWVAYAPPGSDGERTLGTTVRFFDSSIHKWRAVFVAPSFGSIIQVEGGAEDERIVLQGRDTDGARLRWSFNEIQADSFVWRGELSRDDGKTWLLQEEHHMRRRAATNR